jgi:hypothetical protein
MDTSRESAIVHSILKYIKSLPRCYAEKTNGNSFKSGQPDVDAVLAGRAVKLEVKRPGQEATPLQKRILEKWALAGCVTGVVTSVEDVKTLFKNHGLVR